MSILEFSRKKQTKQKLTMITCYDATCAKILSETDIDALLVGDTVAVIMHGFEHTTSASLDMMTLHTAAVRRGAPKKFIVSDLPFLSYRKSLERSMSAVQSLVQAGANAVKIESCAGNIELIRHLTESGVPVMGHLGLMPQFVNAIGGYRVQGKLSAHIKRLEEEALALQEAGCFSVVLECVPTMVGKQITEKLNIPTIGIGAGPNTDGQILVLQDLLGFIAPLPKFVRPFLEGQALMKTSIEAYISAVTAGEFPSHENCY